MDLFGCGLPSSGFLFYIEERDDEITLESVDNARMSEMLLTLVYTPGLVIIQGP